MAVSNAVVGALRLYAGRGPSKAKCYDRGDQVLVVVHDWMTPAEQTWLRLGREDLVVQSRRTFDVLVGDAARGPIRALTACGVAENHTEIDFRTGDATVLFVLDGESRSRR